MSLSIKKEYLEKERLWNVELIGEIDIYTAKQFKEMFVEIYEIKKENIRIDAKGLDYIDSTGLGVMIGALKRSREENKNITIVNAKENVNKLLEITGLSKIFKIEE
ncbi:MAG: STAS domain-containing protein [Clostridiales bacterium]|nr:STAS domain-containing protein [Clostridiales bacterium]